MNLFELKKKLLAAARRNPPSDRVPYAFEKRIMAHLAAQPLLDAWAFWVRGFWRERAWSDMDAWGYSFRLGATRTWFEQDSAEACAWLEQHGITDAAGALTGRLRAA